MTRSGSWSRRSRAGARGARAACAAALLAVAPSCAALGPPSSAGPCGPRFDTLRVGAEAGRGLELVGKLRVDLPPYRLRGLARIVYDPAARAASLDFHQSSLFGAVEEDVTAYVGDSLAIVDRAGGRSFGNDSSLALVERGVGERIGAADILEAFLFVPIRCAGLESASVAYRGAKWALKGAREGRRIEMRGDAGQGARELRECFSGGRTCWVVRYGAPMAAGRVRYPRWVRLSRENGPERLTFELTEIKEVTFAPGRASLRRPDAPASAGAPSAAAPDPELFGCRSVQP